METPLRKIRTSRGLSLETVARAVATDRANLSRLERGLQNATPELAERIADYFGYAITEMQILYPDRYKSGEAA